MNELCRRCAGACCTVWPIVPQQYGDPAGVVELLEGRRVGTSGDLLFLTCRCRHLTTEGRCGIYETRPTICRTFEPLSEGCLKVLEAARPELFKEVKAQNQNENQNVMKPNET